MTNITQCASGANFSVGKGNTLFKCALSVCVQPSLCLRSHIPTPDILSPFAAQAIQHQSNYLFLTKLCCTQYPCPNAHENTVLSAQWPLVWCPLGCCCLATPLWMFILSKTPAHMVSKHKRGSLPVSQDNSIWVWCQDNQVFCVVFPISFAGAGSDWTCHSSDTCSSHNFLNCQIQLEPIVWCLGFKQKTWQHKRNRVFTQMDRVQILMQYKELTWPVCALCWASY